MRRGWIAAVAVVTVLTVVSVVAAAVMIGPFADDRSAERSAQDPRGREGPSEDATGASDGSSSRADAGSTGATRTEARRDADPEGADSEGDPEGADSEEEQEAEEPREALGALYVYDDEQRTGGRPLTDGGDGLTVNGAGGTDLHVEFVPAGEHDAHDFRVEFFVDGDRVRTEEAAPWSLGGDRSERILGHPVLAGTREVRAEVRRLADDATRTLGGTVSVEPVEADALVAGFVQDGRTVVDADFDDLDTGAVSAEAFVEAFGDVHTTDPSDFDGLSVRGDDDRYLRVDVPAGWPPEAGANLQVRFDDAERGCLVYRARFSDDWDWSRGGKLPGPAGVAPGADLADAAGGGDKPEGDDAWSARIMWRNGYAGYTEGDLVTYLYHPGQALQWGDDVRWRGVNAERGEWHEVVQCVAMNTPGERDGELRAWLDGRPVVDRTLSYRTDDDLALDRIFFAVFRGGGDASWAGDRDGHVDFDDVRMVVEEG